MIKHLLVDKKTVLYNVLITDKSSIHYKQFTLATFLNIEEDFNNDSIDAIEQVFQIFGVIAKFFQQKWVESATSQINVLSPLL